MLPSSSDSGSGPLADTLAPAGINSDPVCCIDFNCHDYKLAWMSPMLFGENKVIGVKRKHLIIYHNIFNRLTAFLWKRYE